MTSWTEPQKPPLGTILVVEDEFLLRVVAAEFLENEGFVVLEACNADEAMEILCSRTDVSLVLTDINMPGSMDGLELAHLTYRRWPQIKIVVVSGKVKPSSSDLPPDSRFIEKPYRVAHVISQVRSLLGVVPHAQSELFCSDAGPRIV